MTRKIRAGIATVTAAVMCLATVSASAAEWRVEGYDTSNGLTTTAPILYQEYDSFGLPTGRYVAGEAAQDFGLKGFSEVSLNDRFVDRTFPNNEYAYLYADGQNTNRIVPTGRDGSDLVEYRDVAFAWEVAAPYKIFSIRQAKLNIDGRVQWYGVANEGYPVEYTGENAAVSVQKKDYGFGFYKVVDGNAEVASRELLDYQLHTGKAFEEESVKALVDGVTSNLIDPIFVGSDSIVTVPAMRIGEEDITVTPLEAGLIPTYDVTGRDITVYKTFDLELVGPTFDADGNVAADKLTVRSSEAENDREFDNFGVDFILTNEQDITEAYVYSNKDVINPNHVAHSGMAEAEITWTAGGYEETHPHALYEYLTVDGVVFDGRSIGRGFYLPRIIRYTGGTANLWHKTIVLDTSEVESYYSEDGVNYKKDVADSDRTIIVVEPTGLAADPFVIPLAEEIK